VVHYGRMRDKGHKLKQDRLDWISGENVPYVNNHSVEQITQRAFATSILGVFQDPNGHNLSNLVGLHSRPCFEQEVGLELPKVPSNLNFHFHCHTY